MRVGWLNGKSDWRRILLSGMILGYFLGAPAWAQQTYFTKTRTDANVYVAPVASCISKVAVLPFKAPTELIGSSISDIFVTEILRAHRYTMVERGQIDRVLGETEFATRQGQP